MTSKSPKLPEKAPKTPKMGPKCPVEPFLGHFRPILGHSPILDPFWPLFWHFQAHLRLLEAIRDLFMASIVTQSDQNGPKWSKVSKMGVKWVHNGPKTGPKRGQKGVQKGVPKWVPQRSEPKKSRKKIYLAPVDQKSHPCLIKKYFSTFFFWFRPLGDPFWDPLLDPFLTPFGTRFGPILDTLDPF